MEQKEQFGWNKDVRRGPNLWYIRRGRPGQKIHSDLEEEVLHIDLVEEEKMSVITGDVRKYEIK